MDPITLAIVTAAVGVVTGYGTALLTQLADRRDRLADALADYYASCAAVFYAWQEHELCRNDPARWEHTHREYTAAYRAFLLNSTRLFALVPPDIGEEVLEIELMWERTEDPNDTTQEVAWFKRLDEVRYMIFPLIRNRFLEPSGAGLLMRRPVHLLNAMLKRGQRVALAPPRAGAAVEPRR